MALFVIPPPWRPPTAAGKDSQRPPDLARERLKGVSNANGSFAPAEMRRSGFAEAKGGVLRAGLRALQPPACTHTCVHGKTHEQGGHLGSGATPVVPAHSSQTGCWEGGAGFLGRGECPQGNAVPRETLGSVGAIGTVQLAKVLAAPQRKMGVSNGGAALGSEVAVTHGHPVGSSAVMGSTIK